MKKVLYESNLFLSGNWQMCHGEHEYMELMKFKSGVGGCAVGVMRNGIGVTDNNMYYLLYGELFYDAFGDRWVHIEDNKIYYYPRLSDVDSPEYIQHVVSHNLLYDYITTTLGLPDKMLKCLYTYYVTEKSVVRDYFVTISDIISKSNYNLTLIPKLEFLELCNRHFGMAALMEFVMENSEANEGVLQFTVVDYVDYGPISIIEVSVNQQAPIVNNDAMDREIAFKETMKYLNSIEPTEEELDALSKYVDDKRIQSASKILVDMTLKISQMNQVLTEISSFNRKTID